MRISDTGKYIKIDLSDEKLDKHVFRSLIIKELVENIMEDERIGEFKENAFIIKREVYDKDRSIIDYLNMVYDVIVDKYDRLKKDKDNETVISKLNAIIAKKDQEIAELKARKIVK